MTPPPDPNDPTLPNNSPPAHVFDDLEDVCLGGHQGAVSSGSSSARSSHALQSWTPSAQRVLPLLVAERKGRRRKGREPKRTAPPPPPPPTTTTTTTTTTTFFASAPGAEVRWWPRRRRR
eukprot:8186402-Pyramimonas_sp.AAC.1